MQQNEEEHKTLHGENAPMSILSYEEYEEMQKITIKTSSNIKLRMQAAGFRRLASLEKQLDWFIVCMLN